MIARYQMIRGKRPPHQPLPDGERHDTRKHTRHVLRPSAPSVAAFLAEPSEASFQRFRREYRELLQARFETNRAAFDALAERARQRDVFIGCNCPTLRQPDVRRCHTFLALQFLTETYPGLPVLMPEH